jgi:hypothetical protein
MKNLLVLMLTIALGAATCEKENTSCLLDKAFLLPFGEKCSLDDQKLTVHFRSISDSRCPEGVVCVWAGEATVGLAIYVPQGNLTRTMVLPGLSSDPVLDTVGVYIFTLHEVAPYPKAGVQVADKDYTIRFSVKKL